MTEHIPPRGEGWRSNESVSIFVTEFIRTVVAIDHLELESGR